MKIILLSLQNWMFEVCPFPFDLHCLAFFICRQTSGLKGAQERGQVEGKGHCLSQPCLSCDRGLMDELISSATLLQKARRDFWVISHAFLTLTTSVVWHLKWNKNLWMQNISCTIQQIALSTWSLAQVSFWLPCYLFCHTKTPHHNCNFCSNTLVYLFIYLLLQLLNLSLSELSVMPRRKRIRLYKIQGTAFCDQCVS